MLEDINIFNTKRATLSEHKMRIVIHSNSLKSKIMNSDKEIKRIDALGGFEEIDVFFSIPKCDSLRKIIEEEYSSGIYSYEINDQFIAYRSPDGKHSSLVQMLFNKTYDDFLKCINNSIITDLDIITCNNTGINLLVVDNDDFKKISGYKNVADTTTSLELTRLFMINQGLYCIEPNHHIDELMYYIYRFKKMFYNYQFLWSTSIEAEKHLNNIELFNQSSSLSTRLEFYCKTLDSLSIECLRTPDNITSSYTHYHFNYMTLLIRLT